VVIGQHRRQTASVIENVPGAMTLIQKDIPDATQKATQAMVAVSYRLRSEI